MLAHELAHLRHRDVLVQTTAVLISSALVEASRSAASSSARCSSCSARSRPRSSHLLLSPKREFAADREAARICDSPHGLADALSGSSRR